MDFVSAGLADGRCLRCLPIVDNCTRECAWRSRWTRRSQVRESRKCSSDSPMSAGYRDQSLCIQFLVLVDYRMPSSIACQINAFPYFGKRNKKIELYKSEPRYGMRPHSLIEEVTMKLNHAAMLLPFLTFCMLPFSEALAATDNGTLTKGTGTVYIGIGPGCYYIVFFGYGPNAGGSYSPTGLTGGKTVLAVEDFGCDGPVSSQVSVNNFASDPGAAWLTSVTCNGVTRQASAAGYSYSSGRANWSWSGATFGFGYIANGNNTSCSLTHN